MKLKKSRSLALIAICAAVLSGTAFLPFRGQGTPRQQGGDPHPPDRVVKLIFIHHSTGENWLNDGYGILGRTLRENNYFVSDTNYGWGPDGIGDRTDLPDWEEWFRSEGTETYMEALFNETEQHASYTRDLPDPGGENQIIMFKSCFPNSDLEGSPDDPPTADGWLSVGHAKYVYNEILKYFKQHPEKLFVVITAPPLSDRTNAANARAFNLWLMNDWLEENDYPYQNVAVFDFYNVLTGRDGHHTFENGRVIYQVASKDTLYYPSGDDHPSKKGSQKATDEFVPLLNYFYNRWQADNPAPLAPSGDESGSAPGTEGEGVSNRTSPGELFGLLDDFEGEPPAGSSGWEAYWDEGTPTEMSCAVEPGAGESGGGLRLDYQITPYSWGACDLSFDSPQDWSAASGLAFNIHTAQSGDVLHVDLYSEGPEGRESYLYKLALEGEVNGDWAAVAVPWNSFQRVEWEEDAGAAFNSPDRISGLSFGFGTEEDEIQGTLWIDDLGWTGVGESPGQTGGESEEIVDDTPGAESSGWDLPCTGALALPIGLVGFAVFQKRRSGAAG